MPRLLFGRDPRQVLTIGVVVVLVLAFVAGIAILLLSIRASHLRIAQGTVLSYRLTTSWTEVFGEGKDAKDGQPSSEEQSFQMLGVGPDNLSALIGPSGGGDRFTLMRMGEDGSVTLLDPAERPLPGGRAVGLFDFNLFALPPDGLEQVWDVSIPYGVVPDVRRLIQAKVRRSKSSAHPEFTFKPEAPTIEWLGSGRYRQLKDLTVTFRFKQSQHLIDQAVLSAVYCEELPPPLTWRRWKVVSTMDLVDRQELPASDTWKDLALTCAAADAALSDQRVTPERRKELAEQLRNAAPGVPRWSSTCLALADVVVREPVPHGPSWKLVVVSVPQERRADADGLVRYLTGQGLSPQIRSWVQSGPTPVPMVSVEMGPFPNQDQATIDRIRVLVRNVTPQWRQDGKASEPWKR